MTPPVPRPPTGGLRGWLSRRATHISALVGLTLLWFALGDEVGLGRIVVGLLVALLVFVMFPLPDVRFGGRVRVLGVLWFLARFVADLVKASIEVGWLAVRPKPVPPGAVVAVEMHTRSEFHLTVTALALSLIPGSVIIDVDRTTSTLYVHVFAVTDRADVEKFRREVLEMELRLLRAIGARDDYEQAAAQTPGPPRSAEAPQPSESEGDDHR